MNHRFRIVNSVVVLLSVLLMSACSVDRFIPEGEYLLEGVRVQCDSADLDMEEIQTYVRQHPNNKWFSLFKVPLRLYCVSGADSTRRVNRFFRRLGEKPVLYSEDLTRRTQTNIQGAVRSLGFLNADVEVLDRVSKGNRIHLKYKIHEGARYRIRSLETDIQDSGLVASLDSARYESSLHEGMYFNLNALDAERQRMTTQLANSGYYKFNNDFIRYEADSAVGGHLVDVKLLVEPYHTNIEKDPRPHQRYTIGQVDYLFEQTEGGKSFIRPKVISNATDLESGRLYSERDLHNTYQHLTRLGAVASTNIRFTESSLDSTQLNTEITLLPSKKNSFNAELEGTNSAGDLGAALALSYQNRNLFRGSETFNIKLRGAFEAIKGLSGYADQNYIEYSAEAGIAFPDFKFPFLRSDFRKKAQATSELNFAYDSQDRPEFHRRVLTGAWRYKWARMNRQLQHRIDLLDLNYVFMPWISDTFRERYLLDPTSRNAILIYNYENLFIMKWGYNFTYSSQPLSGSNSNYGTNAYTIRAGVETSGNLLYGLSNAFGNHRNDKNQYTLFNIAYAEYAKFDFDLSKSFLLNEANSLALHIGFGVAYPYGNSNILPYEKRYFSGGANSVRGWSVRELGPGTFRGTDGRIDFINQTGDMKLDLNAEYRTHLFWKFDGAAFIDAGNIWTLREYEDQPGGQFRIDEFWRQIAVSYGLGLRLNFNYFILRFDAGMKAVHPAYTDSRHHFPIIHPRLDRDCTLHFAVGLPF